MPYVNNSLKFLCLVILLGHFSVVQAEKLISASQAYSQAVQIEKEVDLLLKHFKITKKINIKAFKAKLLPRHVYGKAYGILTKIQILRQNNGFSRFTIASLEPKISVDSELVYEQTQRILTELRIIKFRLGIESTISAATHFSRKKPIDVFNKLHESSLKFELLNDEPISPNHVFAVVMKIDEDIEAILRRLNIHDTSFPPAKIKDIRPLDSLIVTFSLMNEIHRLQHQTAIIRTDFSPFSKKSVQENVHPSDVFNMVGMVFSEVQTLKASLSIKSIAAPAKRYEGKTASDVQQLLRWVNRKLRLIEKIL